MRCEECPPVSFQPGKQLCRHSSAADGGLSLGPPSRKPLKSLGRSSTLRPPLFLGTRLSNRDIGKHLLSESGRKIVDPSWTTLTGGNTMKTSRFHACLSPRDGLQRGGVRCAKDPGRLRKGRHALGSNRQEVLEGNVVSCGAKEGGRTGACRSPLARLTQGSLCAPPLDWGGGAPPLCGDRCIRLGRGDKCGPRRRAGSRSMWAWAC